MTNSEEDCLGASDFAICKLKPRNREETLKCFCTLSSILNIAEKTTQKIKIQTTGC